MAKNLSDEERKKREEEIKFYDKEIELDPESASAYCNRGIAKYESGHCQEAIEDFTKVIELGPEYMYAHENQGITSYYIGPYQEAIEDSTKLIGLDPDYLDAYNYRGIAKTDFGLYQEAIEDFTKLIELAPKKTSAYNNQGVVGIGKFFLNNWRKEFIFNNRGVAKFFLDDYQGAIEDYDQAINVYPKYWPAYNNRGAAKMYLVLYRKAIEDFDKAIELDPNYINAYYSRGNCWIELKEIEKAKQDFKKVLDLNPDHYGAQEKLIDLTRSVEEGKIIVDKIIAQIIEKTKDNYIFRGEMEVYPTITSSLLRSFFSNQEDIDNINEDKLKEWEKEGLLVWQQVKQLEHAKRHFPDQTSPLEMLSQIQHFRGPTNLLDFTKNIHIALFFALENYQEGKNSRILAYELKNQEEQKKEEEQKEARPVGSSATNEEDQKKNKTEIEKIKDYLYYEPKLINNRVVFQSSVFLYLAQGYLKNEDCLKFIFISGNSSQNDARNDDPKTVYIKINPRENNEAGDRDHILHYLNRYHNINSNAIYADMYGLIDNWNRENKITGIDRMIEKNKEEKNRERREIARGELGEKDEDNPSNPPNK